MLQHEGVNLAIGVTPPTVARNMRRRDRQALPALNLIGDVFIQEALTYVPRRVGFQHFIRYDSPPEIFQESIKPL